MCVQTVILRPNICTVDVADLGIVAYIIFRFRDSGSECLIVTCTFTHHFGPPTDTGLV